MPETLVERVARAIMEARSGSPFEGTRGVIGEARDNPHCAAAVRDACAAIAAMRDPTEAMIEASRAVTASWLKIEGTGITVAREKARRRFRAMIDAALADCPTADTASALADEGRKL